MNELNVPSNGALGIPRSFLVEKFIHSLKTIKVKGFVKKTLINNSYEVIELISSFSSTLFNILTHVETHVERFLVAWSCAMFSIGKNSAKNYVTNVTKFI